ncbi:MAG: DNA alkylation repair enzyme superfamily [candidate division WS6 bacterium 36_33]|uniref:DNA alkylation repair enzyme superfamily n=1 Tax=candidate division WS6 bacterium 36_33 TaxID=1641388 RepID=A0A101GYC7_9BACT|nr:MAG: DNA alkylation repair enzyme superfamily [candidate division WS6 bacterium 36_33]
MKQNSTKKLSENSLKLRDRIVRDLKEVSSKERATNSTRFFKTGKGEYGEGDLFVGIRTPEIRKISKKYLEDLNLKDLDFFLHNRIHEYRLFAVITLTYMYEKTKRVKDSIKQRKRKEKIFNYYLKNRKWINSWDLVDVSAPKIVGEFLKDKGNGKGKRKEREILYDLVKSDNLWDQRIAIVSTYPFIKQGDFNEILEFSKLLINHEHDLIQKALGWMLREVGKKDESVLKTFLENYASKMPRTMLRYSIERLDEKERQRYLNS